MAIVKAKSLTGTDLHFRDAVWIDADQSGIGLYSLEVPAQCEQEYCNSFGV
jgi:hypothetical protein